MTTINNIVPNGTEQSWDSSLRLLSAAKHGYALANSADSPVKGYVDVTYLPQGDGPNASHAATLGGWQLMLSAYSKNKDASAKLIKYMVSFETQKDHAIKLSRLPTRPAVYEDKDVLAAQPCFSRLRPVFDNAVARPKESNRSAILLHVKAAGQETRDNPSFRLHETKVFEGCAPKCFNSKRSNLDQIVDTAFILPRRRLPRWLTSALLTANAR